MHILSRNMSRAKKIRKFLKIPGDFHTKLHLRKTQSTIDKMFLRIDIRVWMLLDLFLNVFFGRVNHLVRFC